MKKIQAMGILFSLVSLQQAYASLGSPQAKFNEPIFNHLMMQQEHNQKTLNRKKYKKNERYRLLQLKKLQVKKITNRG